MADSWPSAAEIAPRSARLVAHPCNADLKNAFGTPGEMFAQHLYAFHATLTPDDQTVLPADQWLKQWVIGEIQEMVFDQPDTDTLVSMPLPLTDLFKNGLSPRQECAELAQRDPERIVFWGAVNPMEGRKALDEMEIQVEQYGARAFRYYNTRYDYGQPVPWRMDDPIVAFPIFERAQELGVNLIGVHKGVPLGPQPIEPTQTWDMDDTVAHATASINVQAGVAEYVGTHDPTGPQKRFSPSAPPGRRHSTSCDPRSACCGPTSGRTNHSTCGGSRRSSALRRWQDSR